MHRIHSTITAFIVGSTLITASFAITVLTTPRTIVTADSGIQIHAVVPEQFPTSPTAIKNEATLFVAGDIMLSRNVDATMKKQKDFSYPYTAIQAHLDSADIRFANLETPLTKGKPVKTGSFTFRADSENAAALKKAGFDILSLANNHTMNFGSKGMKDTLLALDNAGIAHSGAGMNFDEAHRPAYITKNGITVAFLSYNDPSVVPTSYFADAKNAGTALMDIPQLKKDITTAKQNADLVFVSMHAGIEYTGIPNTFQKNFARAAIDAGADLIIGHHPHTVQIVEKYKGKTIIYSLGNFIFDQMFSRETREGMTAMIHFNKTGVTNIEYTPILIENYAQPRILIGDDAKRVLQKLNAK